MAATVDVNSVGLGTRANVAGEMQSLDFRQLISAPLKAIVDAEFGAAMATTDFIMKVGFKTPTTTTPNTSGNPATIGDTIGEPVIVTFKYPVANDMGFSQNRVLEVPLLTMVPIPMLRIQEATIDFSVKITDSYTLNRATIADYAKGTQVTGAGSDSSGSANQATMTNMQNLSGLSNPINAQLGTMVNLQSSIATKKTNKKGFEVKREYSMRVKVLAVQDDMPAGMERLMAMLESQMKAKPATSAMTTALMGNMSKLSSTSTTK